MLDVATLLDPSTALVSGTQLIAPSADADPFWRSSAILACQHNQSDDLTKDTSGMVQCSTGACAETRTDAVVRTAGEAVERMALHGPPDEFATAPEMGDRAPKLWTAEAPYSGDPGTRSLGWYRARRIVDGCEYMVPAGLVEFPGMPDDGVDFDPGPSGAAAGQGYDDALRRALLEVIERDSVIVSWARQQHLEPFDLGDVLAVGSQDREWDALRRLVTKLRSTGLDPVASWVPSTIDGVVTAVGGVRTTAGQPQLLSLGVKTATHAGRALCGAIQESFQLLGGLRLMTNDPAPHDVVVEEADRMRWLASPEGVAALEAWIAPARADTRQRAIVADGATDIDGMTEPLLDRVLDDGLDPYVVDLTTRLPSRVQQMGWSVVKVIPVGYQPLRIDESRTFGWVHARLQSLEERTGIPARIPPGEIHPLPHPLP